MLSWEKLSLPPFLAFGSKAFNAPRDICAVHGEKIIAERTTRNWYSKLKNGNFDLKDVSLSGPSSSWAWWRAIKPTFAQKLESNYKAAGKENGILSHCFREASSLDEENSER